MSSEDLEEFWQHVVTVETYQGRTGDGLAKYAAAVNVPCWLVTKLRLVRNADAEQVVSSASFDADTSWAATLADKSRATTPDGRTTTIIATASATGGTLIEGLDHVTAYLQ